MKAFFSKKGLIGMLSFVIIVAFLYMGFSYYLLGEYCWCTDTCDGTMEFICSSYGCQANGGCNGTLPLSGKCSSEDTCEMKYVLFCDDSTYERHTCWDYWCADCDDLFNPE